MDIVEEVKKMKKIPVDLILAICDKIGEDDDWREEGETRGVVIIVDHGDGVQVANNATAPQLVKCFLAYKWHLFEDPLTKATLEANESFEALVEVKEDTVDETVN